MSLSIFVAGNPGSVRVSAEAIRQLGAGVEETATGWHRTRSGSEADWDGRAGDAFRDTAGRNGRDADVLAELFTGTADALTVFADDLDTVRSRMEQARQVAVSGGLKMMGESLILEPGPMPLPPEEQKRQQKAFDDAKGTIEQARQLERAAHERLVDLLNRNAEALARIGQAEAWSKAAETATSPLALAAVAMDVRVTDATRAMFEKALPGGPASVHSMWASLSEAQRADLIAKYPQMVGGTDGVPCVDRDRANRAILASQRAQIVSELQKMDNLIRNGGAKGSELSYHMNRRDELREALEGIDRLSANLTPGENFLLGIDSTAGGRGQAIIASGNPDLADNTLTLVPGTFSDLGDAQDYVARNDAMLERANAMSPPGTKNAAIVWAGYNSPVNLLDASFSLSGDVAHKDLSQFQEGLRATHDGGTQSHNTVLGHSYGSTVVGYASREGGTHADELVFLGSPGVGVEHADQLDVPSDHVWGGTAGKDPIDDFAPALSPLHWGYDLFTGEDHHRFGMDPSDPHFGGNILPTDPNGGHSDYWQQQESLDGMARVMTGQGGGPR